MLRAVCFDLGGVVLDSPFAALADLERHHGLRSGSINRVIADGGHDGAWSRNERGELDHGGFLAAFDAELAAAGVRVGADEVMRRLGDALRPRPVMLATIDRLRAAGLRTAAVTNNWRRPDGSTTAGSLADRFDVFVESAVEGVHKPDPAIYRIALERLGVEAQETVFLDDVGRNLKAARALGMTTIKVDDPVVALGELGRLLGLDLP